MDGKLLGWMRIKGMTEDFQANGIRDDILSPSVHIYYAKSVKVELNEMKWIAGWL